MPITFNCACGEQLEVDDAQAGQKARCPFCEAVVSVPSPSAKRGRPVESEDDEGGTATSLNPRDSRRSRRRDDDEDDRPSNRRRRRDEDDDDDERPSKRRRRAYDDDRDEDYRPSRRRRSREAPPPYKLMNGQVVGGIVAIILGIGGFVVGLSFDLVCMRWVVVLVIAGIISLIRGLVTGRDQ